MKLLMKTNAYGPNFRAAAGEIIELRDKKRAKELLDGGYAELTGKAPNGIAEDSSADSSAGDG